jgi:Tol biopolymer transport system component
MNIVTSLNSTSLDYAPTLSVDQLTIIFASSRAGGQGGVDLWIAQRAMRNDAFSTPTNLTELNTANDETGPALTSDGLTLFFVSNRAGGSGGYDIWYASRSDTASPFGTARNLTVVNSTSTDQDTAVSADGRELFFGSYRSGARELWRSIRDCP